MEDRQHLSATKITFLEPFTYEWLIFLVKYGLTKLKDEEFKNYGYTADEINNIFKNFKSNKSKEIKEAFLTYYAIDTTQEEDEKIIESLQVMLNYKNYDFTKNIFGKMSVIIKMHEMLKEYFFTKSANDRYKIKRNYHDILDKHKLWAPML